ncbi:MAG: helix-turn-helix domain-containing protein [Sulfolobales archaeon]
MDSGEMIWRVYTAVRMLGGKGGSGDIADLLGVSRRTVQRYLRILIDGGYVEPVRRGMRIYYSVAAAMAEDDVERLLNGAPRDAPVYELARTIHRMIREARIRGDLVGACKIHLSVPTHSRVTHDIDVIVAREHASMLAAMLKYGLKMRQEPIAGVHVDYRFYHPVEDIKVDVMVDGFREEGRIVWNLAPVLRRHGGLTLEHAVVAKLVRRAFDKRTDAYDVSVSIPSIDIDRFTEIYRELRNTNQELAERVEPHLNIVEEYIREDFPATEASIILTRLREIRNRIRSVGEAKRSAVKS